MVARAALVPREAGAIQLVEPARCALRDYLITRARDGDRSAFEMLVAALPRELPPAIRRAQRNVEIRRLAADIGGKPPGASTRRIARAVAAGGARIEAGFQRIDGSPEFAPFTTAETAAIASRIALILAWAPPGRTGIRWPGQRQLARILGGAGRSGVSLKRVVMTWAAA